MRRLLLTVCILCVLGKLASSVSTDDACELNGYKNVDDLTKNCTMNITTLHFYNTQMDVIPSAVFDTFSKLRFLDVASTQLTSIDTAQFGKLMNLSSLDVSNNSLTHLPGHLFARCESLLELTLSHNKIVELSSDTFLGLSMLRILDLSSNEITALPEGLLHPLVQLNELRLESNHINVIDNSIFMHTTNLRMLYLSYNSISVISHDSFWMLKELRTLDIGYNPNLTQIDFSHMDKLHNVNVNSAMLTTLEIPANVTEILAYENTISHIKAAPDSRLETLYISKNNFRNLHELSSLSRLQTLDLSANNITVIDFSDFVNLTDLKSLIVKDNPISKLDANALLMYMPSLRTLEISTINLNKANLEDFTEKIHQSNRSIFIIDMENKTVISGGSEKKNINVPIVAPAYTSSLQPLPSSATSKSTPSPQLSQSSTETIIISNTKDQVISDLVDRIKKMETIINSVQRKWAENATVHSQHEVEKNLQNLRLMIVWTILVFSLFVSFQIGVFVKRNYNRLRIPVRNVFQNGRTRSHESVNPILEEVL